MLPNHTGAGEINEDFAYNLEAFLSTVSFVELKKDLCNFYINNLNLGTSGSSLTLMFVKDQYLVSMMYSEHLKGRKSKHARKAACYGGEVATMER